jgi:hypothetical protein
MRHTVLRLECAVAAVYFLARIISPDHLDVALQNLSNLMRLNQSYQIREENYEDFNARILWAQNPST